MSAYYSALDCTRQQIEQAQKQIQRLATVFAHVQQCSHCQQIVKVGLSSRTALCAYLLWHSSQAEGNTHEQQQ